MVPTEGVVVTNAKANTLIQQHETTREKLRDSLGGEDATQGKHQLPEANKS